MISTLSSIVSILCYLAASGLLFIKQKDQPLQPLAPAAFVMALIAVATHIIPFREQLVRQELDLGLFNLLSLIGWLTSTILLCSALKKPLRSLLLVAFPLSALLILLSLLIPAKEIVNLEVPIIIHVLLSLLAYALLSLAAIQAIIVAIQDHHLRNHHTSGFIMQLPPLQVMERLLFEFVWVGFLLLTASIVSGFLYLEDMFAQHLAHKTVFSILAWLIFSLLLIGRHRLGWRGAKAIYWTLSGYVLLMLAFVGSKLVLEFILQR